MRDLWLNRLNAFKEKEEPAAVLMVAGAPELIRIVLAWTQTTVIRCKRLKKLSGESEDDCWAWLWENTCFEREKLLARIPNVNAKTQANFDALVANRVLYPDGTANSYVDRFLKERVLTLFARARQRGMKGAA